MNKTSALAFLLISLFLTVRVSYAGPSGCSHQCSQCHKITKEEAKKVISKHQGDVKVLDVHMAPVKGLWEAVIEKENKKGVVYVDFEKKNVIYGVIVNDKGNRNYTQESMEKAIKVKKTDLSLADVFYLGEKNAKYKMVVFADPKCSQCAMLHAELKQLIRKRKDFGFHIVMYPLNAINPGAYEQAKSISCSKSLAMLELSYAGKIVPVQNCTDKAFDHNIAVGGKSGVTGTPTVVFPNGSISFGYLKAEALEKLVDLNR